MTEIVRKYYRHKESGRVVSVLNEGKMLVGSAWVPAITYHTVPDSRYPTSLEGVWTRPRAGFVAKFDQVDGV